jgi:hypothetical protein
VSPSDQPVEIRLTLTREEAIAFLEKLARGELRTDWEEKGPEEVLRANGIEMSPSAAIPREYPDVKPEDVESAVRRLKPDPEWPWNGQWPFFPFVGLLAKPEEGEGYETA